MRRMETRLMAHRTHHCRQQGRSVQILIVGRHQLDSGGELLGDEESDDREEESANQPDFDELPAFSPQDEHGSHRAEAWRG